MDCLRDMLPHIFDGPSRGVNFVPRADRTRGEEKNETMLVKYCQRSIMNTYGCGAKADGYFSSSLSLCFGYHLNMQNEALRRSEHYPNQRERRELKYSRPKSQTAIFLIGSLSAFNQNHLFLMDCLRDTLPHIFDGPFRGVNFVPRADSAKNKNHRGRQELKENAIRKQKFFRNAIAHPSPRSMIFRSRSEVTDCNFPYYFFINFQPNSSFPDGVLTRQVDSYFCWSILGGAILYPWQPPGPPPTRSPEKLPRAVLQELFG